MSTSRSNLMLLVAAGLFLLGVLVGFVVSSITGDLIRVLLFATALVLVIVAWVRRQRVKDSH